MGCQLDLISVGFSNLFDYMILSKPIFWLGILMAKPKEMTGVFAVTVQITLPLWDLFHQQL